MKKLLLLITFLVFISSCSKLNIFGFGEEKSKFEKLKINEYLWNSSKNLLNSYSNVNSDLNEGLIFSDWIVSKKNPNVRFRISVYILGSNLIENNVKVVTEKQINKNGEWIKRQTSQGFNDGIKKKIFIDAKNLNPETYEKI
ncbi:MAG: hypothetical protein CFH28_00805 [Alphaproteobacteria bacterium MarineAlpha6_Bin6]|mgnify:FL=1|nr:hypothetical protein [Pelagibacteraceae bacterium]PPR30299.1 MAG: hypothetical protein CFH28_00805 [Alphaproteobacteria bacterium MarineAlpha6_Bin6]PPR33855.1 MAG: hypothetical protein CFH27_00150 [Alphaproteobacteria bacterium MarineAlpha6_Bin5]|tara:strand:+ start:291 stop:716 length:426 start_codon:yes stop_codon:yes gene_type:complete